MSHSGSQTIQRDSLGSKRLDGRDEPIIDPDVPIVDSHFHLFKRPEYSYLLDDYLADANAGHNIVASVYVETQAFCRPDAPEHLRPLGEVEFANGVAAMSASDIYGKSRVAAAIVGHADFRHGDRIAELLDACLQTAPERFRGVRQITLDYPNDVPYRGMMFKPTRGILAHPEFRNAFRHLASRGLSYDAAIFHNQLPDVADLAATFSDTTIILNHMGLAMGKEMSEQERLEVFKVWRSSLRQLAQHPNVFCKIGGLGMPIWGFGLENRTTATTSEELNRIWSPYIETAIEAFGPDRCMMESNYPPDGRSCGFVPLWNALKLAVRDHSPEEKNLLFHDTATQAYRLQHVNAGRKAKASLESMA